MKERYLLNFCLVEFDDGTFGVMVTTARDGGVPISLGHRFSTIADAETCLCDMMARGGDEEARRLLNRDLRTGPSALDQPAAGRA